MTDRSDAADPQTRWASERTTFERVTDVLMGSTDPTPVSRFAEQAACSETGARQALEQLLEFGIAERTDSRPALYRRNESYVRWKRIETIAADHSVRELRTRLEGLLEQDRSYQDEYGVPDPDAVVWDPVADDPDEGNQQWSDLADWQTVRRDLSLVSRALRRAEPPADGRAKSNP